MANLYRNQRFIVDSDGHELNTSAQHHALEQTARWNNATWKDKSQGFVAADGAPIHF
jgi:hypothetical protein